MTAIPDAIESDSDGFEDILSTGELGRATTCAWREWVATWIHSKPFIEF